MIIDYIEDTPMVVPDYDWSFTDAAGHTHRWEARRDFPGLPVVRTIERFYNEAVGDYRQCRLCGERIDPGYRKAQFRTFKPVTYE